jgi:hypothetical protein
MLQLLLIMSAQAAGANGIPDRVIFRDPLLGPTPVTNLWIIPPKIPDCKNAQEEQLAIEEMRNGEAGRCVPKTKIEKPRR